MATNEPQMKLRPKPKQTKALAKQEEIADAIAKALGHKLRRKVVICLSVEGVDSPSTINKHLGERLGNVSYHIRTLLDLGMLELTDTTPRRGAIEHHYKLTSLGLELFKRIQSDHPAEVSALLVPDES